MKPVLSREESRRYDHYWIEQGAPSALLMENAAKNAAEIVLAKVRQSQLDRVVVIAGVGNNGGDGFAVARHLRNASLNVQVVCVAELTDLSSDAQLMARLTQQHGIEVFWSVKRQLIESLLDDATLVVDALFGTGLSRAVVGEEKDLVETLNQARTRNRSLRIFSLDLPSGLDANSGVALGSVVRAHETISFGFAKRGLLTPFGAEVSGVLHVVPIGVSSDLSLPSIHPESFEFEPHDVALLPLTATAHKYSHGHVAVIGGSVGKTGAPRLSALGALRAGAGAATIISWPETSGALMKHNVEVMWAPLEPGNLGAALSNKSAVVIGPGLGVDARAMAALDEVLGSFHGAVVIDADAISLLASRPRSWKDSPPTQQRVVVPHVKEAARLLGSTVAEVERDRFGAARLLAQAIQGTALLKGAHSLVATASEQRIMILPRGASTLAVAGSGDVLAGVVAAEASQRNAWEATCVAGAMHAWAGEELADAGTDGILAREIATGVKRVRARLMNGSFRKGSER